jgi:hypothetical protein
MSEYQFPVTDIRVWPTEPVDVSISYGNSEPVVVRATNPEVEPRRGFTVVATFAEPVTALKVRRGRLTAKVGDQWHIVPTPKS